jgi:nucleoid DNA-binding protein
MSLGKKDILKNISSETHFSIKESYLFLDTFISYIKQNKSSTIKLSKFGTFIPHKSPQRIGRNPKTKEEFKIKPRTVLKFKASNNIKTFLN